jgi:hypothetical protein
MLFFYNFTYNITVRLSAILDFYNFTMRLQAILDFLQFCKIQALLNRCYIFFPNVKFLNSKFPNVALPNFKSLNE